MGVSVSDRLDLADLAYAYATALDERDVEGFAALFTEDAHLGVYEPDAEQPLLGYDGRAEIAQAVGLLDPYGETMHVVSNHRVEVDGDRASGVVYCLAHHNTVRDGVPHNLVMRSATTTITGAQLPAGASNTARSCASGTSCGRCWTIARPSSCARAAPP